MLGSVHAALSLGLGVVRYRITGRTPPSAHQALIRLFCASGGRFNDLASRTLARLHPPIALPDRKGVLGELDDGELARLVAQLEKDGYAVFPTALPAATCDRLMRFALDTETTRRRMDGETERATPVRRRFDPTNVEATRYDYPTSALLDDADVQALIADHSLLALAQAYLGSAPVADVLSMWWHTSHKTTADSEAAQFFHFDMDRVKWLKIFVYLTDVGVDNGPHSFIARSHRTGGIPSELLHKGYVRLSDEEVATHYGDAAVVELAAPRGTIIVEDTRGLHKGKVVAGAPRLVLQLQLSNSLFGATYPDARLTKVRSSLLAEMIARAPSIYRAYR